MPWRGRSRSRMISGRNSDTTYEQTENLKPGKTSSVTAAPPSTWRRSRTSTLRPPRARYAAQVRPLWPPPITIASYFTARKYTFDVPVGSAFHERTLELCESLNYRDWAGYYAVSAYETHHEHEYNAIRNACALIDISPLFKYRVTGPHASRLVNRIITRDASKMSV